MNKNVMILGASELQLPCITTCIALGYNPIVLDYDKSAIGFSVIPKENKYLVSTNDVEKVLEVAKQIKPNSIITLATDSPILIISKVAEKLEYLKNILSVQDAYAATNKGIMRQRLEQHQIPIPEYKILKTKTEFEKYVRCLKNNYIVKPSNSSGSKGITLVKNEEDSLRAYEYALRYTTNKTVLVEEYMEGPEVSVELFLSKGEVKFCSVTDKRTTGSPSFVELGHTIPSVLEESILFKIKDIAIKSAFAIGISSGPAHVEVIVTSEGPKVVEIGARLGGDHITTKLVPLSYGVDLVECLIKESLGEEIDTECKLKRNASINFITAPSGVVTSIEGVEEARKIPGIVEVSLNVKIGDIVTKLNSSNDRLGYIISVGDAFNDSLINANNALNTIKITTI